MSGASYLSIGNRLLFPLPSKLAPVKGMAVDKLKNFIDDMWEDTDRAMIVRYLMTQFPKHTLMTDYTFEIARLLDGTSKCCIIVMNEDQMLLFIGFADKESEANTRLAHWFLKQRIQRMGKEMPYNAVDDRCCNSQAVFVDVHKGMYISLWGMDCSPHKDPFHFIQLGNKCLAPA